MVNIKKNENGYLNVVELFAGVGGFRVGLERANADFFRTIFANQWEPNKKVQHAFDCYKSHFTEGVYDDLSNKDIAQVPDDFLSKLKVDLLVGGFPCQDYSVARSLSGEQGIQGKKGVLFWQIKRVVEITKPKYVLLENVDRLIKSPSKQRGRDFAVMLATFKELGYTVEWRVIDASEYGNVQRRRRVFIFCTRDDTVYAATQGELEEADILFSEGFFASIFPVKQVPYKNRYSIIPLPEDIVKISDEFSDTFYNAGIMRNGLVHTTHPEALNPNPVPIRKILLDDSEVEDEYFLNPTEIDKFTYLRRAKKVERTSREGHKYFYSEGGMSPTDDINLPGRTMLTSEGTVNRSTHIVERNGRIRYLSPIECERLNGFDDDWTNTMPKRARYFCMGNALVVPLIEVMGRKIEEIETAED